MSIDDAGGAFAASRSIDGEAIRKTGGYCHARANAGKRRSFLGALMVTACLAITEPAPAEEHYGLGASDFVGACGAARCDSVLRGLFAFADRKLKGLGGNGRACVDCHMVTDSFQLSPASVEARWRVLQLRRRHKPDADDPLFRAIDADDFRINGQHASDFGNLRRHALVRVTLPLPPNVRLIDSATNQPSTETVADVWRMVPSVFDVKLTGADGEMPAWFRPPNPTGGYQLDARRDTLQAQARGALFDHAEIRREPDLRMLDDLAAFQSVLFSSPRVRRLSQAIDRGMIPLPDAEPKLTPLEAKGKAVFTRSCAHCHGGPGQSTIQFQPAMNNAPFPSARYADIATACPRPVDPVTPPRFVFKPCSPQLMENVRTYEFTLPDGSKLRRTSSDPGRALLSGFVLPPPTPGFLDDWQKMDTPTLRNIGKTAPYFHNNSADTLGEVLDHYDAFFEFARAFVPPGVVPVVLTTNGIDFDRPFTPAERPALLAYLRKL